MPPTLRAKNSMGDLPARNQYGTFTWHGFVVLMVPAMGMGGERERILFLIQAHPSLVLSLQSQGKVKPNTKRFKGFAFLSYIKLLASPLPTPD